MQHIQVHELQVIKVPKVSQRSNDPDAPLSKARFCFMEQLTIRFGKLDPIRVSNPAIPDLLYDVIGETVSIFSCGGGTGLAPCVQ